MSSINSEEIISILKEEIENFDMATGVREVGNVIWVGDGIATVYGIDHAMYGEIVTFENGVKGMVQDIKRNEIGVIIFGKDTGIKEGTKVARTKKRAGIPVGEGYIGRVVDALGAPIDGKGSIEAKDYRPIENEAPGIIDRKSVTVPMETGILAIDSMLPIGRGQRELIIGDRQTGKTSIAIDTILNQKGKDVICIYVAIGHGEVVVGAGVQPQHLVVHLGFGGEDQHRNGVALLPQGAQHRQSIHFRHHQIQDEGVVVSRLQVLQGLLAVINRIGGVIVFFQQGNDRPGQGAFILRKQNAHLYAPPSRW